MKTLTESWDLSLVRLAMRNSSASFLSQREAGPEALGARTMLVRERTSPWVSYA